MKKTWIIGAAFLAVVATIVFCLSIGWNKPNEETLIIQLGQAVKTMEKPGIYFKIPIIQQEEKVFMNERFYDLSESEVITADKRTMTADCYVLYQVTDPMKFYRQLSSFSRAQGRLDVAVYGSMKKVISSHTQMEVIKGKDGSLSKTIRDNTQMSNYGIEVLAVEMKTLDLPQSTRDSVYKRMISERKAIADEEIAKGDKDYMTSVSKTDAEVAKIVSNAERLAANIRADGDNQYFTTLAKAYSSTPDRQGFYQYMLGLEAMKKSLQGGGIITITPESPLYAVLTNANSSWDISGQENITNYSLEIPEDLMDTFGEDLESLGIIQKSAT